MSIYEEAKKVMPGGVNSPVRAFLSVEDEPLFIERGEGAYLYDHQGNRYLDYIGSWGPMILGHSFPYLVDGIAQVFQKGTSFGLPTLKEIDLAKLIIEAYPACEMVRMVNSGTEATMSAIRLARGYTNKNKIIKFEGNYHGHSDCLLVKAGSGALTFNQPTSPGVPLDFVKNTIVCEYNDIKSVEEALKEDDVACVIIEPIACNMGLVKADPTFLEELRALTKEKNVLLIFDEVISGFRISYGGASEYYGIQPDLACFGKIIGGGLPVGAYGGKKEIMAHVSPSGPVYQAGTLSGNPLAMEMGIRQLTYLKNHPEVYTQIDAYASRFKNEMDAFILEKKLPLSINQVGSLCTLFFTKDNPTTYKEVMQADLEAFKKFFSAVLKRHIIIAPSQFEGMFISFAHGEKEYEYTITAFKEALMEVYS